MLLAIFVNEFGADSPPPNTGRVYVECMDGVPLRRGERGLHREALIARIFTAYLDYVRGLGFSFVHFRAPPPHDDHCQIFARYEWAWRMHGVWCGGCGGRLHAYCASAVKNGMCHSCRLLLRESDSLRGCRVWWSATFPSPVKLPASKRRSGHSACAH